MGQNIFREKSLERINSPEQLDQYLKVSNPGLWLILGAVIVLLVGVIVWGFFGHLDTTITCAGVVENGTLTVYIDETSDEKVAAGTKVQLNNKTYKIESVEDEPVQVDSSFSSRIKSIGDLENKDWVYEAKTNCNQNDGIYEVTVVLESVAPKTFIVN